MSGLLALFSGDFEPGRVGLSSRFNIPVILTIRQIWETLELQEDMKWAVSDLLLCLFEVDTLVIPVASP